MAWPAASNLTLNVRRLLRTHFCVVIGSPAVSGATNSSAYVTDGRKAPPLELTEALQIGCAMTRG
jgi:hypothetical protein